MLPSAAEIRRAADAVYEAMPPTPQFRWPLLGERAGAEVWLKHENHTPLGAFKIRSALAYFRRLRESGAAPECAVAATRGNYGQAVAFAARREGIQPVIYVPHGNSESKNRAMRALGARLVEFGEDFEEARQEAVRWARAGGHHVVPSFHPWLVEGTATLYMELFTAAPELDVLYVPVGMGSGICGAAAARAALGVRTLIVGVCSAHARAQYDSFERGEYVVSPSSTRIADGMAVPAPDRDALAIIREQAARIVMVSDGEVAEAMRAIYDDTHNIAEGAGAAGVAALLQEKDRNAGRRVAAAITGGNVDRALFAEILAGAR
ncbi:MAG: threonine dehydratase [Acidobacteriota bacterium]|nr:threonine dehydratase [Acidobacteriota bacterium]